jgi:hypothetical protein
LSKPIPLSPLLAGETDEEDSLEALVTALDNLDQVTAEIGSRFEDSMEAFMHEWAWPGLAAAGRENGGVGRDRMDRWKNITPLAIYGLWVHFVGLMAGS